MNIGIRLHDMAPGTLEERARVAKAQGFTCAHLALSKTIGAELMDPAAATPGLARHIARQLDGLDVAVLGCYLNLAHPDPAAYAQTLAKYKAHVRLARWLNASVLGTETGAPNAEYRYDPLRSHTPETLEMFIRRLAPVVECAERFGVTMAIEPVCEHIVHDGPSARYVLDAIASDHLKIIFDPVNLIGREQLNCRDEVIAEAIDLLGDDVYVVHLKDYEPETLRACACGTGCMDYTRVMRFVRERKPQVQITLENTTPQNAEAARVFVEGFGED